MKLRACIWLKEADKLSILRDIGFNYVETSIMDPSKADEREIYAYREALEKSGLKCESSAKYFPSEYTPAGEQTKEQLERAYEQL